MISVREFSVGLMGTNAYIVTDNETQEVAVIDPGFDDAHLTSALDEYDADKIRYILLTHGHFDHIGAAKQYAEKYNAKIVISDLDSEFLFEPALNLCGAFGLSLKPFTADIRLYDEDVLELGETEFSFIHTPGHTRGSGCYVFEDDKVIFSGDTLFLASMGRTDFPTGDANDMIESLHILRDLEGDYKVYPGHDQSTTLSYERVNNPYMK